MPSLLPSPRCALTAPFHPYRPSAAFTVKDLGGLFSVALSVGSRPPGVAWHLIRRSPDFPPPKLPLTACATRTARTAIARPAPQSILHALRATFLRVEATRTVERRCAPVGPL